MKKSIAVFIAILGFFSVAIAQKKIASPPEVAVAEVNGKKIAINYGSPSVKGREIWGKLVPFDKVWRAGANEATTFSIEQSLKVDGNLLPAGVYSLFIIPNEKECTIIFSKQKNQWGAYDYKQSEDQLRIKVVPKVKTESTEKLNYSIIGETVSLKWEKWDLSFRVN